MRKLILLCVVFVFSNAVFAQEATEKIKKAKAETKKK